MSGNNILPAGFNEYGKIERLGISLPADCFVDQARCDGNWEYDLFIEAPDFDEALREYDAFRAILDDAGIAVDVIPVPRDIGMSAVYARDSSIISPKGVILGSMANPSRQAEPANVGKVFEDLGIEVCGRIEGDGLLEGGDFVWFDERTCAVAHGCRTNGEGIRQLKEILGADVHVEVVGLPYWEGPVNCLHLMSFISPVADDLAVVYSRMMPVPFRDWLLDRGMRFIEVPDEEYDPSMGCNVLAVAPGVCVAIEGNPETRRRMEKAGCEVIVYKGDEVSVKGGGGPTCLTRPIIRS